MFGRNKLWRVWLPSLSLLLIPCELLVWGGSLDASGKLFLQSRNSTCRVKLEWKKPRYGWVITLPECVGWEVENQLVSCLTNLSTYILIYKKVTTVNSCVNCWNSVWSLVSLMNSQWSQCLFFAMIRPRLWPSPGLVLAITLSDASFSGKLVSKRYGTLQPFDRLSEWVDVNCLTKQYATRNSRSGRGNHSRSKMEQEKWRNYFLEWICWI